MEYLHLLVVELSRRRHTRVPPASALHDRVVREDRLLPPEGVEANLVVVARERMQTTPRILDEVGQSQMRVKNVLEHVSCELCVPRQDYAAVDLFGVALIPIFIGEEQILFVPMQNVGHELQGVVTGLYEARVCIHQHDSIKLHGVIQVLRQHQELFPIVILALAILLALPLAPVLERTGGDLSIRQLRIRVPWTENKCVSMPPCVLPVRCQKRAQPTRTSA